MCVCLVVANYAAFCRGILRGMSAVLGSIAGPDDCFRRTVHSDASDAARDAPAQDVRTVGRDSAFWLLCDIVVWSSACRSGFRPLPSS